MPGCGIIYTLTVHDAYLVADWLKSQGLNVEAYTSDTGYGRVELEEALLDNRIKALVATTALGMGYDKPDLAFVIHYQTPGSVVAYYQQVGRAGRALDAAYGVLLSGREETDITDWFIQSAFPTRREVAAILEALESEPNGLSVPEMMRRVNVSSGRIEKTMALLALEAPSPIVKLGSKWQLAPTPLSNAFWERAERLTSLRRDEQQQMQKYVHLPFGAHMGFLIQALDGDPGVVTGPGLPPLPTAVDAGLVQMAVAFLRRGGLPFWPRRQWPAGGMPVYGVKGLIPPERQAQTGRALSFWGDDGWGVLVRNGKYQEGFFADALIEACVTMIREWNPQPAPAWVTCLPSLRHPELVPGFARRLAGALGLPFHGVIVQRGERPEQKTMANSIQQARNVDGSLVIEKRVTVPHGPVLLIDDMVDSRWTLTVCAWLLRAAGSGEVWPLALAKMRHG